VKEREYEQAVGHSMMEAAEKLPEGWEICIGISRGCGSVTLVDPSGREDVFQYGDGMQYDIRDALLDAIERDKLWPVETTDTILKAHRQTMAAIDETLRIVAKELGVEMS